MVTTTRPINFVPCPGQDLPEPCRSCPVRDLGLCAALDDPEVAELQRNVRHLTFDAGQTIVAEGEPARHIFIVIRGAAALQKSMADGRRQITAVLLPGDVLGTGCDGVYGYSAETLVSSDLCRITNRTLDQLCARSPHFERHLRAMLGRELCEAQSRLLWLGRKSAAERLASFLLMLAERAQHRGEPRNPVNLFMTRKDVADCLGLTEETVSRTFTQLVNRKLIRLRKRTEVVILHEQALRDMAEGQLDTGVARPLI